MEIGTRLQEFAPEAVHIATEGPLGHAAHRWLRQRGWPFTTAFHTQFPEYLRLRVPVPVAWSYAYLRRFHAAATSTLVPTQTQRAELEARGFRNLKLWSRGVDTSIFNPEDAAELPYPRPINVYLGRIAVEKNIEAFLDLRIPGTKLLIGDGPDLARLRARYDTAVFLGAKFGRDLARHLAGADVFVFPSLTDTFGLVMLEAMACGLPVAAFPVQGPLDVVDHRRTGVLDEQLARAIAGALTMSRENCVEYARGFTWERCTSSFLSYLSPIPRRPQLDIAPHY